MSRITPSNPANSLTPSFSTVASPGGFQSGDLVYFKDSSFGLVPGNALASAPFNITATNAPIGGPFGRNAFVGVLNQNANRGVLGRQRFAATLTNGNVVVVYAGGQLNTSSQGNPRYTIVDSSFNTVVAETTISGSDTVLNSQIGVAALTGGGFAVIYTNGSSVPRIAVFSNTGAVVTAPFTPAGWSNTTLVDIEPLANGGFVASGNQGGPFRVATYNATGTQINANTTSIGFNGTDTPQIVTLTDNRFVVLTRAGTTSAVVTGFNADCTTVGVGPTFSMTDPTSGNGGALSICVLSNNEVVLAYSESGGNTIRKYFISSNTLGSTTLLNGSGTAYVPTVTTLPGDNIAAIMQTSSGQTVLQIVSSSFANISNTTYNGISLDTFSGNRLSVTGILVGSTLTYFVSTVNTGTNTGPSTPIQYYQFGNTAPYAPVYRRTQSIVVGTATSPVSGYARSTSTPNRAAFLASTSTTVSNVRTVINGANFVRAPYLAKSNVAFLDTCVMSNGRMVIAYSNNTTAPGFLVVDVNGNVLSDITITAPQSLEIIRCTALNSGRLLIAFANGNQNITFQVYDESFTLLSTNDFVTLSGVIPNNTNTVGNGSFTVSSIGSDRFIVGYCHNAAARGAYAVFTDSLAFVVTGFLNGGTTGQAPQVAGNIDGTFTGTHYTTNTGQGVLTKFIQTGPNLFEEITQSAFGWSGSTRLATTSKMSPNGVGCMIIAPGQNTTSAFLYLIANPGQISTIDLGTSNNFMSSAVAIGATGEIVGLKADPVNGSIVTVVAPGAGTISGGPIIQNGVAIPSATMNSTGGGTGPCVCLECLYDRTYAFAYRGPSSELYIGLFSSANITYSATLVAGVTGSAPALSLSPANGYYLSGVAASDCAAGGTGVVQTNGAATLNSQYSATTTQQAFDFTSPTLNVGARGTIAGRNMVISGE